MFLDLIVDGVADVVAWAIIFTKVFIADRVSRCACIVFPADQDNKVDELRARYPFPCQDEGYHLPWMLELGSLEFRDFLDELRERVGIEVPAVPEGEWCE